VVELSIFNYTREQLQGFFEWQMISCLKHFPDEYEAEDQAKAFAFSRPRADGFITFQTRFKGKRFFWIKNAEAEEIEAMECYLRTLPKNNEKTREANEPSEAFKKKIQKILFKDEENTNNNPGRPG
jgi:hypothetical protein